MSDKILFRIVITISVFICVAVIILNQKILPRPEHIPDFVKSLPKLNAFINGACSMLLLTSLYFIKRKKITIHKRINITAFVLSSLFLVSYITFHWLMEETKF